MEAVLQEQSWIVPEARHYHYEPGASSALGADRSSPETQISSVFSGSVGGMTRDTTPDGNTDKRKQAPVSAGSAAGTNTAVTTAPPATDQQATTPAATGQGSAANATSGHVM